MQTDSTKRKLIWAGAAAAGVAVGVYLGQRHLVDKPVNAPATNPASSPSDPALKDLWAMEFELPDGGAFKFGAFQGRPIVLNFWATWCPPCVEELPLLDRFYRENVSKGWQVVGIAADSAKAVKQFLAKTPFSFPAPLAGLAGVDLSRSLGNLAGALPFTVVINRQGAVATRHMGKLSAEQISAFLSLAG